MSTHNSDAETRKTRPRFFDEGGEQSLCFVTARRTHTVPLPSEGSRTIGRASQADIRLDDDSVSRCHARVDVGDALTLEDLGSRNGTQLRDRILGAGERAVLRPGDIFFLGEVLCLV